MSTGKKKLDCLFSLLSLLPCSFHFLLFKPGKNDPKPTQTRPATQVLGHLLRSDQEPEPKNIGPFLMHRQLHERRWLSGNVFGDDEQRPMTSNPLPFFLFFFFPLWHSAIASATRATRKQQWLCPLSDGEESVILLLSRLTRRTKKPSLFYYQGSHNLPPFSVTLETGNPSGPRLQWQAINGRLENP